MKKQITYKMYPIWISFTPQVRGKVRGPPMEKNFRSQKFLSDGFCKILLKKCDILHIKINKVHHI